MINNLRNKEKLIQRINELYFDLIYDEYDVSHPSIILLEKERWNKIANNYLKTNFPMRLIDIGTGTGFVPLNIAKYLKNEDFLVCTDLSKSILDKAKNNINKGNYRCNFEFIKLDKAIPFKFPFDSEYADIITMNSVLHHVYDIDNFIREIDRILKHKGLLIIGHEPNKKFYENKILWYNYKLIKNLIHPRYTLKRIIKTFSRKKNLEKESLKKKNITRVINNILLKERIIKKPLNYGKIYRFKDIRSKDGFMPDFLFKSYKILYFETYNYLHSVYYEFYNHLFIKIYERIFRLIFPNNGSKFAVVYKKR